MVTVKCEPEMIFDNDSRLTMNVHQAARAAVIRSHAAGCKRVCESRQRVFSSGNKLKRWLLRKPEQRRRGPKAERSSDRVSYTACRVETFLLIEHLFEKLYGARVFRFAKLLDGALSDFRVRMRACDFDEQRNRFLCRALADGVDGLHLNFRVGA